MYAATIDTGATIATLRKFGLPEVVPLDDFAGNANVELGADKFITVVQAVTVELGADGTVVDRLPLLQWFAGEAVPYAQAQAPFALQAGHTGRVTFALDVQQAGAVNAATIIAPMPELVMLPGHTLELSIAGGAAGDTAAGVRITRQRYQLVTLEELIED